MWNREETVKSSTWRELKGVYHVLCALFQCLEGHRVKWFTDNLGVVTIVAKGSMASELQEMA